MEKLTVCPQMAAMTETEQRMFEAQLLHAIRYNSDVFEQAKTVLIFADTYTNVFKNVKFGNDLLQNQKHVPLTQEQIDNAVKRAIAMNKNIKNIAGESQ